MKLIIISFFVLLLFSCSKEELEVPVTKPTGGVAFCFDDQYIDGWDQYSFIFNRYNFKATFCVSRINLFTPSQQSKLISLYNNGFEIACHSLTHASVKGYVGRPYQYIENEVDSSLAYFDKLGIPIFSFAYPYGDSDPVIDSLLLERFQLIRKANYNYLDTTLDVYNSIFASKENHKIVDATGIDVNFEISPEDFKIGLKRALANNEILIVYAHKFSTDRSNYSIHPEYLDSLLVICNELGAKSFRLQDIEQYYSN